MAESLGGGFESMFAGGSNPFARPVDGAHPRGLDARRIVYTGVEGFRVPSHLKGLVEEHGMDPDTVCLIGRGFIQIRGRLS